MLLKFLYRVLENSKENNGEYKFLSDNAISFLVIDTLSKAVGGTGSNSDRVQNFVKKYGNWSDCERVSLPHISRLIELIPNAFTSALKSIVDEKMRSWSINAVWTIEKDPMISEFQNFWPANLPKEYKYFKIERFQHISLLYRFRNDLIHELKDHGQGHIDLKKPYYHKVGFNGYFRLYYSPVFIRNLALNCLNSSKKYFDEKRSDQHEFFSYGDFMYPELNNR